MSSGKPFRPQGSDIDGTRRMLDELDALMERMLALPGEDNDPSPPPNVSPELLPRLSATLTLLEQAVENDRTDPTPAGPPQPAPLVVAPNIPSYVADLEDGSPPAHDPSPHQNKDTEPAPRVTAETATGTNPLAPAETPAAPPWPGSSVQNPAAPEPSPHHPDDHSEVPPPLSSLPEPEITPLPLRPRPWASLALFPLLGVNWAWDFCTWLIGPPGRWLRTPACKNLLGFAGLGLLAMAAGWLLKDWMGWTW